MALTGRWTDSGGPVQTVAGGPAGMVEEAEATGWRPPHRGGVDSHARRG